MRFASLQIRIENKGRKVLPEFPWEKPSKKECFLSQQDTA